MKTLDRTRHYGEVCGYDPGQPGARYHQDGLYFSVSGDQVSNVVEPAAEVPMEKPRSSRPSRAIAPKSVKP